MMIPYGHQEIDDEDIEEVVKVLKSDLITTGPKVQEFEEALCRKTEARHATVVSSGTSALDIAVRALDFPEGSEAITTPFTFVATSNCLLHNNLVPVYADIEARTRNIDPDDIRDRITEKTRAIIFVDYAGHPCRIDELREIAEEHDLRLIEDACHALGAEYHGKKVGTLADMTVFSFHPVKHITTGEGGAVTTNDDELDARVKQLRHHGISKESPEGIGEGLDYAYDVTMLSRNYRLTDLQCALGISQLNKLDDFLASRERLANTYDEALTGMKHLDRPQVEQGVRHAWHLYTVLLDAADRDRVFKDMREKGVGVHVHYIPTYRFSYYRQMFDINPKDFPVTEEVFRRILTLPLHPSLEQNEVAMICDKLGESMSHGH